MTELLTAAQMRAIEAAAIASGAVTGLELMERAGRGVVEAIFAEWPELATGAPPRTPGYLGKEEVRRAVVLCGPGNNGGDGFVVARLLRELVWEVEVFLYGDPEKLPPDARVNYERWVGMGKVERLPEGFWIPRAAIVVDALFGTGLSRPIADTHTYTLSYQHKKNSALKFVAIDVPSGICADSGRAIGVSGNAALTVTFHQAKIGHYLQDGPSRCGKVVVKDIGIGRWVDPAFTGVEFGSKKWVEIARALPERPHIKGINLLEEIVVNDFDKANRFSTAHKYTYGHALILSGPPGHGGAARLAARGALRIGAGLVTVGCAPEAVAEHAGRMDAIMVRGIADGGGLAAMLEDRRITALCLGPGLGLDERAGELLAVALGVGLSPPPPAPPHEGEGGRDMAPAGLVEAVETGVAPPEGRGRGWGARRIVLDADALTLLARNPGLFAALHQNCVLTPHAGEFARLFPDIAEKLAAPATRGPAYSKVDATREAAARAGCVVLFKGPDTVIAGPDGECSINSAHYDRAAPWLATAGSGDVLAGFIAGLLARGFRPMAAAETAAWLHVECARSFGPGLIAEDLPEELPKVFRALGL